MNVARVAAAAVVAWIVSIAIGFIVNMYILADLALAIDTVVELVIYGAIVGAIYKPVGIAA